MFVESAQIFRNHINRYLSSKDLGGTYCFHQVVETTVNYVAFCSFAENKGDDIQYAILVFTKHSDSFVQFGRNYASYRQAMVKFLSVALLDFE